MQLGLKAGGEIMASFPTTINGVELFMYIVRCDLRKAAALKCQIKPKKLPLNANL